MPQKWNFCGLLRHLHCAVCTDVLQPVRNLGVYFDSNLRMQTQVAKVMQTCFFQLRRLHELWHLLVRDVTDVIAALEPTRLDYGNAVLPYSTITPLQHVINAATRQVHGLWPRDHFIDVIIELHWLPICAHIQFKLFQLVHRTLNCQSPSCHVAATSCHHKTHKSAVRQ